MFNNNLKHNFKTRNILEYYGINEYYIETVMNKMYDSSSKEYYCCRMLFKRYCRIM